MQKLNRPERAPLVNCKMPVGVLLVMVGLMMGATFPSAVFANFCQISNISYNYPQQLSPRQSFITTTKVSGTCAPDDSYYYSIRVDLSDMAGQVLSYTSVPIGYGSGQYWQVTVLNQVTAPTSVGSWQIQFIVYVFGNINSGGIMDSKTTNMVIIQLGTMQTTQSISSSTTVSQAAVQATVITTKTSTSIVLSTQTAMVPSSGGLYASLVVLIVIIVLVIVLLFTKQRQRLYAFLRKAK